MNILICVFFRAPLGGLHGNVFSTARHCVRGGIALPSFVGRGPFREQLAAAGVHTIATDYASTAESVDSVLTHSNRPYDVIQAHPVASRQVALELGRRLGIPVVVTYHGMYDDNLANLAGEYAAIVAVSPGIGGKQARTPTSAAWAKGSKVTRRAASSATCRGVPARRGFRIVDSA